MQELKHNRVLTDGGVEVTPEQALELRVENPDIGFYDLFTGKAVFPRSGTTMPYDSIHRSTRSHFVEYSEFPPEERVPQKKADLEAFNKFLREKSNLTDIVSGLLKFHDQNGELMEQVPETGWDHGLMVSHGKGLDGNEYAVLLLDDTPSSADYFHLINNLGDRSRLKGATDSNILKSIVSNDAGAEKTLRELGKNVYLSTVFVKNQNNYRLNRSRGHDQPHLMLGDTQVDPIAMFYQDQLYFYDPETQIIERVNLPVSGHSCDYGNYRVANQPEWKKNRRIITPAEFCRAIDGIENITHPRFERYELNKDTFAEKTRRHNRLYLSHIKQDIQLRLF